ncbi:MAG: amino acid permease [Planctomycetota bacterium]|nr:amino acid permease [Planctomycetota bacterium]
MHASGERPRELRWYHAAGMLFGDWGTSRLYVLGIAFVLSGHASFWYVAAMCALVTLVGFAYTIICAHFPDGGGVYSAAKHRSRTLAVVGALLLVADYVITAALSAYEGFRYILPQGTDSRVALYAAIASIAAIGAVNYYGPRRSGLIALVVAIASAVCYFVIGLFCLPSAGHAVIEAPRGPLGSQWSHFVNVILALSGVEAIANMTGVMAEPVAKNARKAILLVLLEVVVLNLAMAYAMNAMTQYHDVDMAHADPSAWEASALEKLPEEQRARAALQKEDLQDHMIKILAEHYVGKGFAVVASILFGLLLLSAANTAMGDMVSIQYLMSRDKELPSAFTRLNVHGMPWVGLITAIAAPVCVLLVVGNNLAMLADLYAIGVVGAIAINLGACGTNLQLDLKRWERAMLLCVGVVVTLIWFTIAVEKPRALLFAGIVLVLGLLARNVVKTARQRFEAVTVAVVEKIEATTSALRASIPSAQSRILVASRGGNAKLLNFAISYARDRGAAIYLLFVREVTLTFREREGKLGSDEMTMENDPEAMRIFSDAQKAAGDAKVPLVPIYVVHDSPPEMILDYAALMGVDAVLMGVSQRGALYKTLRGDILQEVTRYLPQNIPLLIHA